MEKKMSENKKKVGIPKVGKTISEVQEEFGKTLEERRTLALERIADSASALVLKPCIALVGVDRSQSLFYFVPQSDSHSQAGSTKLEDKCLRWIRR